MNGTRRLADRFANKRVQDLEFSAMMARTYRPYVRNVKVNFTPGQGMKTQRGYSSITSALDGGWVVNATPRPLYPLKSNPVPIVKKAGYVPGSFWMDAEYFVPTGNRSP